MKIWLVEDDPDDARRVVDSLRRFLYAEVEVIPTHKAFVDRHDKFHKSERLDLVIMDVILQTGWDLDLPPGQLLENYEKRVTMLSEDPRTKSVPILTWSVQDNSTVRRMPSRVRHASFFCGKSTGVAGLLKTIQSMFPNRRPRGEVFLAHGHDFAARDAVAAHLRSHGLRVIILADEPGRGRTIIEQLEATEMTFGVVLLTPDDVGGRSTGGAAQPRARQRVILELGYLIGRLGRNRVCALRRPGVEPPSDVNGVLYLPFDDTEIWKYKLDRELTDAGLLGLAPAPMPSPLPERVERLPRSGA